MNPLYVLASAFEALTPTQKKRLYRNRKKNIACGEDANQIIIPGGG
jgi:hypothetical protein